MKRSVFVHSSIRFISAAPIVTVAHALSCFRCSKDSKKGSLWENKACIACVRVLI